MKTLKTLALFIAVAVCGCLTSEPARADYIDTITVAYKAKDAHGTVSVSNGICTKQEIFQLVQFATMHQTYARMNTDVVIEEVQDFCATPKVKMTITPGGGTQ